MEVMEMCLIGERWKKLTHTETGGEIGAGRNPLLLEACDAIHEGLRGKGLF